jgi:hypothetical protein
MEANQASFIEASAKANTNVDRSDWRQKNINEKREALICEMSVSFFLLSVLIRVISRRRQEIAKQFKA